VARALLTLAGYLLFGGLLFAGDAPCSQQSAYTSGECSVTSTLTEEEAVLEGTIGPGGQSGAGTGGTTPTSPTDPMRNTECPDGGEFVTEGFCISTLVVTLSDIAAFRPSADANLMEPNGWAVTGLPTNFYSTGGRQIQSGTLLGTAADVRFTPVAWTWTYGDGTSTRSSTSGASWAALGIPEFDETPTSHVYAARGTYTITLAINYRAEYRLGTGPWTPIAGTLRVPSNPLTIAVGSMTTVLVDKDCRQNPSGPGC